MKCLATNQHDALLVFVPFAFVQGILMIGEIGGQVGGGKLDLTICMYFCTTTHIFSLLYYIFLY